MIGRRAFANKLIKDSNVDVRYKLAKILASASSSPVLNNENCLNAAPDIPPPSPVISTSPSKVDHGHNQYGGDGTNDESSFMGNYCDTPINDLVDPIDYEDFISSNTARIPSHLRPILFFPTDDLRVEKYEPPLRTLESTSTPEFNNVQTSEDPYIQSIGAYAPKSLIVVKKYEKCSSVLGLHAERLSQSKELKRQEYEIDLSSANGDSFLNAESDTPNTFCSRRTSVTNTPRPQSLISSSSAIRPPLASDEEDYIDEDLEDDRKTPIASESEINRNTYSCDIPSIDSKDDNFDGNSLNGDVRNSWIYTDANCNLDKLNTYGSRTKSLFSLQNSQSDPHIQGILDKDFYRNFYNELPKYYANGNLTDSFVDDNPNAIVPIFRLHSLQYDDEQIESRPPVPPPSDVTRYRLQVKCKMAEMGLTIEPLFFSLAIHDIKARKKVTENFYFDMNSESLKRLLRSHIHYQDLSTLSRTAIFSLSELTPDMFLVIKLEKVFQGDVNDIVDSYARPPDDSNKIEKLKVFAAGNCERLGRFRMPFAWTAIPLTDILTSGQTSVSSEVINEVNVPKDDSSIRNNSSSLDSLKRIANECTPNFVRKGSLERHSTLSSAISNFSTNSSTSNSSTLEKRSSMNNDELIYAYQTFKPVTITSKIFYRHDGEKCSDDDLYKLLQEFKRPSNQKRLRCMPGIMKIDICSVLDETSVKCRVNPELVRLHPYVDDRISPVKELLEFRDLLVPHFEPRHLLYLYPRTLNRVGLGSARNISIKVQLLASEEKFSAMPVIFGKSSCPELLTEAYTAINYHNRSPNFSEEFKIRLPTKINKQTHIFFTFIHVHTKQKGTNPIEEIVGYTWLPLWRDDCLQTGSFSLPVLAEAPTPGYSFLSPNSDSLPNAKWIENHKPLFVVHLEAYSSIFAQDPYVDRFFRITSSLDSQTSMASYLHSTNFYEEFSRAITGLTNASTDTLVKFVHLILNRLILLMVRPPQIFCNQNKSMPNSIKSFRTLIFETTVMVVNKINNALYIDYSTMRSGILSTFIQFQAVFPQPEVRFPAPGNSVRYSSITLNETQVNSSESGSQAFHDELLYQAINSNDVIREKLFENAFFLFDIIFKSLCVHLSLNGNLTLPPRQRVSKPFLTGLEELVRIIAEHVYTELQRNIASHSSPSTSSPSCQTPLLLQNLNQSLAFFIRDLLSVMDRNFVLNFLIKTYFRKLCTSTIPLNTNSSATFTYSVSADLNQCNAKQLSDGLLELRIDFLRVLSGHEHFVQLNLPFGTSLFNPIEQNTDSNKETNSNKKIGYGTNALSPSSSFAKAMLNSSLFSHSIFDRIRPNAELTDDYRRQHWPMGLIFCTLVDSFTRTKTQLQLRSANILRSLMTSHDWDKRYKESVLKSQIACLYIPLIGIMIDVIPHLYDKNITRDNPFYSVEENRKYRQSKELSKSYLSNSDTKNHNFIDNNIAMAIAGTAISNSSSMSTSDSKSDRSSDSLPNSPQHSRHMLNYQPIGEEATRTLLSCFLWVIGNVEQRLLRRFLTEFSNERLLTFLELLRLSLRVFEYEGEKSFRKNARSQFRRQSFQKLEDVIRYGSARRDLMRRRDFSQSFGSSDTGEVKLRWRKDSTLSRYSSLPHQSASKAEVQDEVLLEGNLCTMMNLIIIDSVSLILSIFRERIDNGNLTSNSSTCFNLKGKYASDEFVLSSSLHVLLQLLALNQSTYVLEAALNCQRALFYHFPDLLFIEGLANVEFCSEVCYLLLKHCGSRIEVIRSQASASMYLLMRQHFTSTSNFSRIKIQITMSLSQLVGANRTFNEIYIRRSLKSILKYAVMDSTVQDTQFSQQIQELVFNLHHILSDTMQMKEHEQDPEMLIDLMYRVAKGYQSNPEIKLTWLVQHISDVHKKLGNHLENAVVQVHAAAIVAECLHKISRRSYLPASCVSFQRICPNVFEESLNSNSDITIDKWNILADASTVDSKHGVRSAKLFSEQGFVSLLEQAAYYFNAGGMFEAVNEVYKLLIPIHEAHHRYKELADVHSRLHDVFLKIDQNEGKRVFATYFRVGFFGARFGDLDHEEFVYKERFLAKLPEISHRLESFYASIFGAENVEVIKDSNPVDITKLDPDKAYIQITYVEPYFDSWELESRHTSFERNFGIKRFIYSTPFTFDGRAHGQLYEQCKRKTILTTTHAFPYVKTRIQVQNRHQLVLSPIEVAIEDVQKKTNELFVAVNQEPVDPKILQMVLQGCVGTTVNQGPAEIAFVFLSDEPNMPANCQRPPPVHKQKLRKAFKDFSTRCGEALTKNRQLVNGHEQQIEYHKELERNFYKFTERLAPLMGNANTKQALILLRESYFSGFKPIVSSNANNVDPENKNTNGSVSNGSIGRFGK